MFLFGRRLFFFFLSLKEALYLWSFDCQRWGESPCNNIMENNKKRRKKKKNSLRARKQKLLHFSRALWLASFFSWFQTAGARRVKRRRAEGFHYFSSRPLSSLPTSSYVVWRARWIFCRRGPSPPTGMSRNKDKREQN